MKNVKQGKQDQAQYQPDPFKTPSQIIPGKTLTRLVKMEYICHICGEKHQAEYYLTVPEDAMSQVVEEISRGYQEGALKGFLKSEGFQNSVNMMARRTHSQMGDDEELGLAGDRKAEKSELVITRISLTDETQYTCDHCRRTFESIGFLRVHQGQNPHTMEQYVDFPGGCMGTLEDRIQEKS